MLFEQKFKSKFIYQKNTITPNGFLRQLGFFELSPTLQRHSFY
nr:hypothetical protein [Providencia sp.]